MIHEQSLGRNCQIRGHRGDCVSLAVFPLSCRW